MSTQQIPVLRFDDVGIGFPLRRSLGQAARRSPAPRLTALDGVSMDLNEREALGIVGESGSGKTTFARAAVRLYRPDTGSVLFHGSDLAAMNRREIREERRRVQLIYQDPYSSLNPRLTVGSAIAEPAYVHGIVEKKLANARAIELLERVGLSAAYANRLPRALSGGQRQRVAIARALAAGPEVVIADEAVSALDVSIQAQIMQLFASLRDDLNIAMMFISHQLSVVAHVADRVAVMYLGRVVELGPTEQVFTAPAHPYTAALLRAQTGARKRGESRAPAVTGEIPSPLNIPAGCRFRTRCPVAMDICAHVDPPPVYVSQGHVAACHRAEVSVDGNAQKSAGQPAADLAR